METPKTIPITTAKKIARDLGYTQVVIFAMDKNTGIQSVCTYGESKEDCINAAISGNQLKRALGWPEDLCNAKPARIKES